MEIKIELNEKEIADLKSHLLFRMQWIQAGMEEKQPEDIILGKILSAVLSASPELSTKG